MGAQVRPNPPTTALVKMIALKKSPGALLMGLLLVATAFAQNGDHGVTNQPMRVAKEKIPPAPPLSPADEMKTFKLPPGFQVELVASEPLVEVPIALTFDPNGRIYVLEMRGFMPNPEAIGEKEPVGRVTILEDTDGDGRMDKRTTFLDGLVMPRALTLVRGGVLVAEPPHLWFCRDKDGDGKCDEKIEVATDYGSQANPEHTANGLLWALDNWIYSANYTFRLRNTDGRWLKEPTINRGQWGIAQDDFGRLFFNSNSDQLRADFIPSYYVNKRGMTAKLKGLNEQVAKDQAAWPIRVNPGVNRGYEPKQLRDDGTLATVTAACGPVIYRGDIYPDEFKGNAFVCEPSGNIVKRNVLTEKDGVITGKNPYASSEFLASTDERFRPVNLYTGPDGALYLVDMYHGILQHRIYMTSYLRKQVEERGLDKPQNQGRIYRIVHESKKPGPKPSLAQASPAELVKALIHPNGWWRDTAQRLLVEKADATTVVSLKQLAASGTQPIHRLHALWVLEGMGKLDPSVLTIALGDGDPKVRAAGLRLAETSLKSSKAETAALRAKVLDMAKDNAADVQIQLALTLGEIAPDPQSKELLAKLSQSELDLAKEGAKFSAASREPAKPQPALAKGPALSAEDQKRFESGKAMYEATCLACHQPHGLGQEGLAPPLVGSEWVAGPENRLIRIVMHGLRGPIKVKKQAYELDMPALGVLEDEQIADVLTYVRREWGNTGAPVTVSTVKRIREETAKREDAWTEADLLRLK
jgi:mono/diheme cytochrome c family protein/glucose/arabinose dehydrogenase